MNENFLKLVEKKHYSIEQISCETGISYELLLDLVNRKMNINQCAAEIIYKLTLYFECSFEDLLNPILLVAKASGKYRDVSYKWVPNSNKLLDLVIFENGKEVVIDANEKLIYGRFYKEYRLLAEARIDVYLLMKEAEAMANG